MAVMYIMNVVYAVGMFMQFLILRYTFYNYIFFRSERYKIFVMNKNVKLLLQMIAYINEK